MTLINPVPSGTPTDPYGPRGYVPGVGNMGFHTGKDIAAPSGTAIGAAHSGTIRNKWWDAHANGAGAGGWMVSINGDDGLETRYAHMLNPSTTSLGQHVSAGQTIGLVGASGSANGSHLHLEVLVNGGYVDPDIYLTGSNSGDDDMTQDQEMKLNAIYAGMFGPQNVGGTELSWASANGVQKAFYGNLEIDIHTQRLVSQLTGQVSALTELVKQLGTGGGTIDMSKIEAAAEKGARDVLKTLTLKAQ